MFGWSSAKDEAKKRGKAPAEPSFDTPPAAGAVAAPVEGLTIEAFAKTNKLPEAEVWRRLRRGELIGRTRRGRLIVYATPEAAATADLIAADRFDAPAPERQGAAASAPEERAASGFEDGEDGASVPPTRAVAGARSAAPARPDQRVSEPAYPLPPLPGTDAEANAPGGAGGSAGAIAGSFLTLAEGRASASELALLLDHLSLAKEENREILRMTQESIRKVTQLSDAIVEMKDTVIQAKEAEIHALREQLETRSRELAKLKQHNEDLEMLARTMAEAPKS